MMLRAALIPLMACLVACGAAPADATTPAAADATGGGSDAEAAGGTGDASGDSAAGGGADDNEFKLNKSDSAAGARGVHASKIKPTRTEAAVKFFVVDKDKGPIRGVVISLTAPDGRKFYTGETDAEGYAEVLVPVGQKYELMYLSLGRRNIAAKVPVSDQPNQNIKLTLRYKRYDPPKQPKLPPGVAPGVAARPPAERFVLKGVTFDTAKATIRDESFPRLDTVVEYMTHKTSARIEISGHTDNVGSAKGNKKLSEKRAQACRDYLVAKGIDADRIEAHGYGDEQPIADNSTEAGRQKNRRIEATEL